MSTSDVPYSPVELARPTAAAVAWRSTRITASAALVLADEVTLGVDLLAHDFAAVAPVSTLLDTAATVDAVLSGTTPRLRYLCASLDRIVDGLSIPARQRRRVHRVGIEVMTMCAVQVFGRSPVPRAIHAARHRHRELLAAAAAVTAAAFAVRADGDVITAINAARVHTMADVLRLTLDS